MRVLFINQTLGIGGAETFNTSLLSWLNSNGCGVLAYTTNNRFKKTLTSNHVLTRSIFTVIDIIGDYKGLIKGLFLFPIAAIEYMFIFISNLGFDVLLMTGYIEKIFLTPLAKLFNKPCVWIEFAPPSSVFNKFFGIPNLLYRLVKHLPDATVVPSKNTLTFLKPHNPVLIQLGALQHSVPSAIPDNHQVCCVSRLEAGKGQDLLIKAWAIVTKQIPNAHLLIIGEGEQYSYLKALIDKLHLNSSVELLGWVRDQYQYIKNSQLVVHPTTWVLEGFGMVSVEALSLARPVVAFKFGPIPEIVDNKVGRLVKPNSIDDLANSIIALLANPPLCRKLGNAGYKKYLSHFTMDRVGRDFIKLFKEVAVDNKLT